LGFKRIGVTRLTFRDHVTL